MPGEFELIAALRERIERAGAPRQTPRLVVSSGDDAAVTEVSGATVTTVDAMVEGVHFDRRWSPLRSIGHKALAAALSDLAAMGAEPGEAYVQLGVPEGLTEAEWLELADGLGAVAAAHGIAIAGGDVTRAPVLMLALTAVGYESSSDDLGLRSGARPGDALVVTGELGAAAAGLLLLRRPELAGAVSEATAEALRQRQLEPEPRIAAGRALVRAGATAMIDVSDGIGADAAHLCAASAVAARIELSRLPLAEGVQEIAEAAGTDALDLASSGGEDYELLAALPPEAVEDAVQTLDAGSLRLTAIGQLGPGEGVELIDPAGSVRRPRGFDQLATRSAPGDPGGPAEA